MKPRLLIALSALVSSCYMFDPNLPLPQRSYGQSAENAIAAVVTKGFRKPGTHHVPRGTTVRELLEMAQMLPNPGRGAEAGWWSLKVAQLKNGNPVGFISRETPTEAELNTILEDGAQVSVIKWNL